MAQTDDTRSGLVELKVDGAFYGGWKKVRVTRSIEQAAGTFELEASDRWPGQVAASPVKPGRPCQVLLDGELVITGYIDTVAVDLDANQHNVRIVGRDKTADLVDCSAVHKSGQWHNVKLDQLARDLIKPFGVELVAPADVGARFASFNIQEGEKVFECLERAARQRALLLTSDPDGRLVITRTGSAQIAQGLVEGEAIKAVRGEFTWRERFSAYTVKGHTRIGADGEQVHSAAAGKSADEIVTRHRPLVVISDSHSTNTTLRDRAEWERNVRRGRSARASITVQGWRHAGGGLWQPNHLVPVTSASLWLDSPAELLIVGCTWTLDDRNGTLTEMAVSRPEAFQLLEGVAQSKLFGKLRSKEQREKREKSEDWSML
jgi:prophage tail gpP-like protein